MSTAASLQVVTTDPTPPYEQLRRQLAELIESGVLPEGDRLPPVRQLASDLGLASGTVARTYRELESAGLVSTRRGGGTRVRRVRVNADVRRRELLDQHAKDLVRQARALGATDVEVREAVDAALSGPGG